MQEIKESDRKKMTGKIVKKACRVWGFAFACSLLLSGCAGKNSGGGRQEPPGENFESETQKDASGREKVSLTVWGAQEDTQLMEQIISDFQDAYQNEADFQITYGAQGETNCKDAVLGDLEQAADVFAFADDQLNALAAAGALEPVQGEEEIKKEHLERAVEAACAGGTMYAYPLTADNGYFLYYNKQYFSETDIQSLEQILATAAGHQKKFAMDWSSAWYVYSFFGNTGLEAGLNDDGITNYCTWNSKEGDVRGVDVAQAMLDIAKSPGFSCRTDEEFMQGVLDGTVIAGVSGVWNAVAVQQAWGSQMGASKLPFYTCAGKQIQMASYSGCKLIGVNAYSDYPQWAAKLAEWIISEENQKLRFEMRGQGPSNRMAAQSPDVQASPAIAALLAQSQYSQLQRIGGNFWEPVQAFALNMAAGNESGEDLQKQLDDMAEKVMAR